MKHLPSRPNEIGLPIPNKCPEVVQFAREMSEEIIGLARYENERLKDGGLLRPAIFVGCHSSSFDEIIKTLFSCAMTPANTYVRSGVLSPEAFVNSPPIMPLHFYVIGASMSDVVAWMSDYLDRPVSPEDVRMAQGFYSMFVEAKDQRRMLDALETLLSFDAGRGWLQMQIEIAGINGVPEHGEALRRFVEDYKKRWHSQ
jgi:hypothetical protein